MVSFCCDLSPDRFPVCDEVFCKQFGMEVASGARMPPKGVLVESAGEIVQISTVTLQCLAHCELPHPGPNQRYFCLGMRLNLVTAACVSREQFYISLERDRLPLDIDFSGTSPAAIIVIGSPGIGHADGLHRIEYFREKSRNIAAYPSVGHKNRHLSGSVNCSNTSSTAQLNSNSAIN